MGNGWIDSIQSNGHMYGEAGGKRVHTNVRTSCIHLHVGHKSRQMYIMVFFRLQCNCNGMLTIRLIIMVFLRNTRIVMAPIQLTQKVNHEKCHPSKRKENYKLS